MKRRTSTLVEQNNKVICHLWSNIINTYIALPLYSLLCLSLSAKKKLLNCIVTFQRVASWRVGVVIFGT